MTSVGSAPGRLAPLMGVASLLFYLQACLRSDTLAIRVLT